MTKYRYEKDDDVLMIWFNEEPVDHAEQQDNVILHVSRSNRPVLLEILDASKFLKDTAKHMPQSVRKQLASSFL